jgi:hypothetical protein
MLQLKFFQVRCHLDNFVGLPTACFVVQKGVKIHSAQTQHSIDPDYFSSKAVKIVALHESETEGLTFRNTVALPGGNPPALPGPDRVDEFPP